MNRKKMVNTRSSRENQDASERGPQPQKETTGNQEGNSRLSITAEIHKIIDEKMGSILNGVIKPCPYKTFLSCQPPEFSGSTDPTAILNWITEMEMTFDLCECREEQKVKFAVRMLKGNAFSWWNVTRMLLGDEAASHLTWGDFVEKYVGHLAPSDEDCVARFVAGLSFEYSINVENVKNLNEAICVAKRLEEIENEKEEREDVGEKRKWGGELGSLKKSKGEVKSC
ncbi:unnamed protein product [Lactuca virosa]|uniref:Retrotransposon gag domain-containing protein n=1 Tax=Lactuca virosa TaxID=75947 RepID=A0AAU9PT61_9ASTR|nr:unnamed protein product [Lactuca virosa]